MGYSFTDLGAEGCCRSLNALCLSKNQGRGFGFHITKSIKCRRNIDHSELFKINAAQMWINPMWPSKAIWGHSSDSTLPHVMDCCLTAQSHYKDQCWLCINDVQFSSMHLRAISQRVPWLLFCMSLQMLFFELLPHLQWSKELKNTHKNDLALDCGLAWGHIFSAILKKKARIRKVNACSCCNW